MNTGGIYKIINKVNSKLYIGSSKNIRSRLTTHKRLLKKGVHPNQYLQNSWNKYGEENFCFEKIEFVENDSLLLEKEQYWLDKIESFKREVGYNICRVAGSTKGVKMPEHVKKSLLIANW